MKHDFSKDLFDRYVEGKCTEAEKAVVEGWYLTELKNTDFVPKREHMNAVRQEIWKGIDPEKKAFPYLRWTAYAAAILLAVVLAYQFEPKKEIPAVAQVKSAPPILLQDSVLLASKTENSMMKLPDGTVVILEKGSKLTLFAAFNKRYNREVELQGHAFFDVAHNPAKPFIIYTGNVRTTVLGTAFDINAPVGSKTVKVNVIRGLVEVKSTLAHWSTYLKKNMQVVTEDTRLVSRKAVDAEQELSWNNKESILFNDISFKEAKTLLEGRFKVKINLNDADLQSQKFSTSLRADESLNHFLNIICGFLNAQHQFNSDSTVVSITPLNHN